VLAWRHAVKTSDLLTNTQQIAQTIFTSASFGEGAIFAAASLCVRKITQTHEI